MSSPLIIFKNNKELMSFAEEFIVKDRLHSLDYDVKRCLALDNDGNQAPLPALMYCFSVIDLLGTLYAGNTNPRSTTVNSKKYMTTFMKYQQDVAESLQKVYRHKIVHLSAPKTAVSYEENKVISWKLHDNNPSNHLTVNSESGDIDLFNHGKIHYDGKFVLNLDSFKDNIKDSITRSTDGYLAKLQNDTDLQDKFTRAINYIYDPNKLHIVLTRS